MNTDTITSTVINTYPIPERWRILAACRGIDVNIFFPSRDEAVAIVSKGKSICDTCVVKFACLNYAISHNIQHGIWGGESVRGRRKIRKERLLRLDKSA